MHLLDFLTESQNTEVIALQKLSQQFRKFEEHTKETLAVELVSAVVIVGRLDSAIFLKGTLLKMFF